MKKQKPKRLRSPESKGRPGSDKHPTFTCYLHTCALRCLDDQPCSTQGDLQGYKVRLVSSAQFCLVGVGALVQKLGILHIVLVDASQKLLEFF